MSIQFLQKNTYMINTSQNIFCWYTHIWHKTIHFFSKNEIARYQKNDKIHLEKQHKNLKKTTKKEISIVFARKIFSSFEKKKIFFK